MADWLELLAITSAAGQVSISTLKSQLRRTSDDRTSAKELDADADDSGEPEVTDRAADDLEERVVDELSLRVQTVGSAYPFELVVNGKLGESQILRRKPTWNEAQTGELFYTFCLLDSCMREDLVKVPKAEQDFVQRIGNIFQICSCIAVGGYTEAQVVSFGFPRATGDGFLPALQAAWLRYGSYTVRQDIPHGFDAKLKDGGVDIIAWRPFDDGHAATFLMFVQVASGLDWKDKPVANDVKAIKQWFVDGVFEHFMPAICIPFPLWFDLDEPPKDASGKKLPFKDGILRRFAVRESAFGVIFDRGRIAQSSARVLGAPGGPRAGVDGVDRIGEVAAWVDEVMASLAEKRAAA
ncbi:hypothetical protein BPNPMPFG_007019 (plasmid) [Mesorhizobium sp. AR07]|uniref:hypothetical protein n=1 Tax=Mesorhizobium sp. AR07 TaxID=2865838 RepID=UPI00215F2C59|nr:hypothetical protein [Mesorhizobium sp. AR07]UVK48621.1 hypothetical protein BPNPMPFG_007019 [Mesorhizobium sp. AR07]